MTSRLLACGIAWTLAWEAGALLAVQALPPIGVLSVRSDPADATVYVDGQPAGRTPLNVPSLAVGDHRVRLVKDGYLEHSRVVTIGRDRTERLQVSLTARTAQDAVRQADGLQIRVIEGEGAVNIIQQKTAVAPLVEVRDRNDLPVSGAVVTFTIGGKAASFAGGVQTLTVTTNAAGRAAASALSPLTSGGVQIQVSAAFQGQVAGATIAQTNVMTAAEAAAAGASGTGGSGSATGTGSAGGAGGGGLSGTTLGIVGAAVGVGAAAKIASGGDDDAPATTPAAFVVSPTGAGITEVTVFTFTASAGSLSSPTFSWDFGDNSRGSGNPVTHTYSRESTFQVRLTVSGSGREETVSSSVRVGSLSGTWLHTGGASGVNLRLVMAQQGNRLNGQFRVEFQPGSPFGTPENPTLSPLSGTISNPRAVTILQGGECLRTVDGTVDPALNNISGPATFGNPTCLTAGSTVFIRQ
jgi:hypothetical protein